MSTKSLINILYIVLNSILLGVSFPLIAQSAVVRFSGKSITDTHIQLAYVEIENETHGWEQTIIAPDTTLVLGNSGFVEIESEDIDLSLAGNPFSQNTDLIIGANTAENATFILRAEDGKELFHQQITIPNGKSRWRVTVSQSGLTILTIKTESRSHTLRLVNTSPADHSSVMAIASSQSFTKADAVGEYQPGDMFRIVGYALIDGCMWKSVEVETVITGNRDQELFFETIEGALPGMFSVSATKRVHFSKGNLQYQPSTSTWRFANSQYEFLGSDNVLIGETSGHWMDSFAWGTSGYHDDDDPYNVHNNPYSNGDNATINNTYNAYGFGPSTNMPSPDLTGKSMNYDWGIYNSISNGGRAPALWRTLTAAEWSYLLTERMGASEKIGGATIEGANGYVIIPDEWTQPQDVTFTPGGLYSHNIYNAEQWAEMECSGAVFLPAAGSCNLSLANSCYDLNNKGNYWSTTHDGPASAYCVFFTTSQVPVIWNTGLGRYIGRSVRLVLNR